MTDKITVKEMEELSEQEAIDNFNEIVEYIMDIDDKEITDFYGATFMLIARYYSNRVKREALEHSPPTKKS